MTEKNSLQRSTFGKSEKLCRQKAIDRLFSSGSSFIAYPLRVVFFAKKVDEDDTDYRLPQVLISVPKRKFKRANKRNRIKRLIREAYRLNKHSLIEASQKENRLVDIAFLFLKDELPSFSEVEKAMIKAISTLSERIEEKNEEVVN